MSEKLSSAAVVIGALRVKRTYCFTCQNQIYLIQNDDTMMNTKSND